jgi:hypothetical protein
MWETEEGYVTEAATALWYYTSSLLLRADVLSSSGWLCSPRVAFCSGDGSLCRGLVTASPWREGRGAGKLSSSDLHSHCVERVEGLFLLLPHLTIVCHSRLWALPQTLKRQIFLSVHRISIFLQVLLLITSHCVQNGTLGPGIGCFMHSKLLAIFFKNLIYWIIWMSLRDMNLCSKHVNDFPQTGLLQNEHTHTHTHTHTHIHTHMYILKK